MDVTTINFAVYEDANEYVGIASATLPDLTSLVTTLSGAGIAGNIDLPIIGHFESLTLTLNFRNVSKESIKLSAPYRHDITLRLAQQQEDTSSGDISVGTVKHVFSVIPKTDKGGNVAPASTGDGSGEYAVHYWATYVDGKKVREIDPLNYICIVDGTDYLADVRSALGK